MFGNDFIERVLPPQLLLKFVIEYSKPWSSHAGRGTCRNHTRRGVTSSSASPSAWRQSGGAPCPKLGYFRTSSRNESLKPRRLLYQIPPDAEIARQERAMNALVYGLYGLSAEAIDMADK